MKKQQIKALIIIFISMVLGASIIIFEDKILSGLAVAFGGASLGLIEILEGWNKVNKWLKSFKTGDEEDDEPKYLSGGSGIHIKGDHNTIGDVAMFDGKIKKKTK